MHRCILSVFTLSICTIGEFPFYPQVLAEGYLMIGIDGSEAADGSDWFCYHSTSPSIFPVGFCEINKIELTPPRGNVSRTRPSFKPLHFDIEIQHYLFGQGRADLTL